jgi:hypothetical protein
MSKQLKSLLAGAAAIAVIGTAIAQGTPPNPNVTNPPVGAGQQSSQGTPMGTTGVQGAGTGAATGSSATMGATSGSTSGSTMGATSDTTTAASDSRPMRADRN